MGGSTRPPMTPDALSVTAVGADPGPLLRALDGLSAAVLGGGGPSELVRCAAGLIGLPVASLGPDLRIRAWAAPEWLGLVTSPGLSPEVRDAPAVRAALGELGPRTASAIVPPSPAHGLMRRHLLTALIVEDAVVGYLDVSEMGRPLEPWDATIGRQTAAMLSLHMLGELRARRLGEQTRADVVADLLRGSRAHEDIRRLAVHIGLDPSRPHVVVRLPVARGRSATTCRDEVLASIGDRLGIDPPAMAEPDAVVLLAELPAGSGPRHLRAVYDRVRGCLDRVETITGVRRAVVSEMCRDLSGLPAAATETRDVDALLDALGGTADVVGVGELNTLRLVVNGDRTDVAVRFAEQCLGPLRRSDHSTGGDLVDTLRRYLECGGQVRATAKAIGVHENTVRYRLGRIEHVAGLDMRNFDALLAVRLAFQIEGLTAGSHTGGDG